MRVGLAQRNPWGRIYPAMVVLPLCIGMLAFPVPGSAQTGGGTEILADKALDKADIATLQAETELLETIRKGMALSIALCEPDQPCAPPVNRDELQRIIAKVAQRIDILSARHSQTNDAALEPVMLGYVDVRDNFTKVLDQLVTLVPEESAPEGAGGAVDFADVFEDADQVLGDDEGMGEDDFEAGLPQ
ncbi:MAG: hypothetical protein HYY48_03595 [Gammaproteobacteria bacterium]|nr:hypothetical protein [Gammaproteobacteria bacterium]